MKKSPKNGPKMELKSGKMTFKNRSRKRCEKGVNHGPELQLAVSLGGSTIHVDAPQVTYKSKQTYRR